jgi:sugar/nucleoside kinase (ribokinase family)
VANRIRAEHVPAEWKNAAIVYLCPVADEVDLEIANYFSNAIIGVSPQGWMRQWDKEGRVRPKRFGGGSDIGRGSAPALQTKIDAIILSEEDLTAFPDQLSDYLSLARYVLLTQGKNGATLFADGERFHYPAFQTYESDPTGAGDVFSAAFLIKYFQTLEPHQSTIFANCVASFAVEKEGTRGIPNIQQVLERLKRKT